PRGRASRKLSSLNHSYFLQSPWSHGTSRSPKRAWFPRTCALWSPTTSSPKLRNPTASPHTYPNHPDQFRHQATLPLNPQNRSAIELPDRSSKPQNPIKLVRLLRRKEIPLSSNICNFNVRDGEMPEYQAHPAPHSPASLR